MSVSNPLTQLTALAVAKKLMEYVALKGYPDYVAYVILLVDKRNLRTIARQLDPESSRDTGGALPNLTTEEILSEKQARNKKRALKRQQKRTENNKSKSVSINLKPWLICCKLSVAWCFEIFSWNTRWEKPGDRSNLKNHLLF